MLYIFHVFPKRITHAVITWYNIVAICLWRHFVISDFALRGKWLVIWRLTRHHEAGGSATDDSLASTLIILRSSCVSFSCILPSLKRADSSAGEKTTTIAKWVKFGASIAGLCMTRTKMQIKHAHGMCNHRLVTYSKLTYQRCWRNAHTLTLFVAQPSQSGPHPTSVWWRSCHSSKRTPCASVWWLLQAGPIAYAANGLPVFAFVSLHNTSKLKHAVSLAVILCMCMCA